MSTGGKIPVIECFGPTIQGEGLLLGTPTNFLRLGGCGYRCAWCDSMHAVLPAEVEKNRRLLTQEDIALEVTRKLPWAPYLTLTGGDPCIHEDLSTLVHFVQMAGIRVAVETQGQFFPEWLKAVDVITFSPKGPSSKMNTPQREFRDNLLKLKQSGCRARVCVKIVVFDEPDLDYAFDMLVNLKPGIARPLYDHFTFQVGSPLTLQTKEELEFALDSAGVPKEERPVSMEDVGRVKRAMILDSYEWLVQRILQRADDLDANITITPQQHTLLWPTQDRGR